ncbi:MAG: hypothetical protein LLG13_06210 [Bacteroidales bacterium]|nr:hypothetical protein [Bacteroidales bacterium]
MKNVLTLLIIFLSLISCKTQHEKISVKTNPPATQLTDTSDMTNNFYDNTDTYALPVKDLFVEGEIVNSGKVNFSELPLHSVIVKETLLDSAGGDRFVGAYRYDGYSLFDILDKRILKKSNTDEFKPIIDVYVEVENEQGEKVVFSWGEIYYPNNLHKIIIATGVSRIVPSKTKDLWPLPAESRIVAASDLITERNISSPVKITVKSVHKSFPVVKGMSPLYSSDIKLFRGDKQLKVFAPENEESTVFKTVFYGRGKGIHSTEPFAGILLGDLLQKYYPVDRQNLQSGMMCFVGIDGYRCAVSYSEIFNRNDQQEFLLVRTKPDEDGGLFRIFPACDFFSDRAIKSVSEIHLGF